MANVEPIVKHPIKTSAKSSVLWLEFAFSCVPSMQMRKVFHFVRSARRSKKKPTDSLIKLYAKMIRIW